MAANPLDVFNRIDPELLNVVESTRSFALSDGALPRKYKLLIALTLDAVHGAVNGVTFLARQAIEAGVTKEEITEAIRVAQFVSGVGSTYTAGSGLSDLF